MTKFQALIQIIISLCNWRFYQYFYRQHRLKDTESYHDIRVPVLDKLGFMYLREVKGMMDNTALEPIPQSVLKFWLAKSALRKI